MPEPGFTLYTVGKDLYKISDKDSKAFESEHPDASVHYSTEEYNYNIPLASRKEFLKDVPDAKLSQEDEVKWNPFRKKYWKPQEAAPAAPDYEGMNYQDVRKAQSAFESGGNGQFVTDYEAKQKQYEDYQANDMDASPEAQELRQYLEGNYDQYLNLTKEKASMHKAVAASPEFKKAKELFLAEADAIDESVNALNAKENKDLGISYSPSITGAVTFSRVKTDPNNDSASLFNQRTRDILNQRSTADEKSGWSNYWKGAADKMGSVDFLTRGLAEGLDDINVRKLQEKLQGIEGELEEYKGTKAFDKKVAEKMSELSEGERNLLRAYLNYGRALELRENDIPLSYKSGQMFADTVGYMMDFMLTENIAGIGKSAVRKAMGDWARNTVLGKLTTSAAGAVLRTPAMFGPTLQIVGQNLVEMDQKPLSGDASLKRSVGNAIANALFTQFAGNWSEEMGDIMEGVTGKAIRSAFKQSMTPATMIGRNTREWLRGVGGLMRAGKFNGILYEDLEEVLNSLMEVGAGVLTGNKIGDTGSLYSIDPKTGKATGILSPEAQAELFLGFLPVTAVSTLGSLKAAQRVEQRYSEGMNDWRKMVEAKIGVTDADLAGIVDNLENESAEGLNKLVGNLYSKIRKGGEAKGEVYTEAEVRNMMNKILEGQLAHDLQGDLWAESQEKMDVANAYGSAYGEPLEDNLYDANKAVETAAQRAEELGLTDLNKDASILMRESMDIAENGGAGTTEKSEALYDLAMAKASQQGINDGWQDAVKQQVKATSESIRLNLDSQGYVAVATYNGMPVGVVNDGSGVEIDGDAGTVSINGADGLVRVRNPFGGVLADADGNEIEFVKASQLSGVNVVPVDEYVNSIGDNILGEANRAYEEMQNTVSHEGMAEAVLPIEGHSVLLIDENGNGSSVAVLAVNPRQYSVTVKDSESGAVNTVSIDALYNMAQKDDNGDIMLDPTSKDNQAEAPAAMPVGSQGPAPTAGQPSGTALPENIVGEVMQVTLNGIPTNVLVTEVSNDGIVSYDVLDEDGNAINSGETDINTFAQGLPAPEAVAPTQPAAASQTPAQTAPQTPVAETPKETEAEWQLRQVQELMKMSDEERHQYVDAKVKKRKAVFDKEAQRLQKEIDKIDLDDISAERAAAEKLRAEDKAYNEARLSLEKWQKIQDGLLEIDAILPRSVEDVKVSVPADKDYYPQTPMEAVAWMFTQRGSSSREREHLNQADFMRETGYSAEDCKKLFGLFSKDGMSVRKAAEKLATEWPYLFGGTEGDTIGDDHMARSAILDFFHSVRTMKDVNDYTDNARAEASQREADVMAGAIIASFTTDQGMTVEEYENGGRDEIIQRALGEAIFRDGNEDFITKLVEELKAILNVGQEISGRLEQPVGQNEQGAESRVLPGGNAILPPESPFDGEGQGDLEPWERPDAPVPAGPENGTTQGGGEGVAETPETPVAETPVAETPAAPEEPSPESEKGEKENNAPGSTKEPGNSVPSGRSGSPATLAEARARFEAMYGKGKTADQLTRMWELTHEESPSRDDGTNGIQERVLEQSLEPGGLTEEKRRELRLIGMEVGTVFVVDEGLVKFKDFFRKMVELLGDGIRPYVKSIYLGVSADVADEYEDQMDDRATVRAFDENISLDELNKEENGPVSTENNGSDVQGEGQEESGDDDSSGGSTAAPVGDDDSGHESPISAADGGVGGGPGAGTMETVQREAEQGGTSGPSRPGKRSGTKDSGPKRGGRRGDGGNVSGGIGGGLFDGGELFPGEPTSADDGNGTVDGGGAEIGEQVGSVAAEQEGNAGDSAKNGRSDRTGEGGSSVEAGSGAGNGARTEGGESGTRGELGGKPALTPEELEKQAYENKKKEIASETNTDKLKDEYEVAKQAILSDEITATETGQTESLSRHKGEVRALQERLREIFASTPPKSESLAQEKVPYKALSDPDGKHSIGSVVPSGAADAMRDAIIRLEKEEGKSIAAFVKDELGYKTLDEMFTSAEDGKDTGLSAEQVDSVGLAIHQMKKDKMFIIGDMTGVGKGRQGAAIIRWAKRQGHKVLFVTENSKLFSDMYRDMKDIGSDDLIPFIINDDTEANITNSEGDVVIRKPSSSVKSALYESDSDVLPEVTRNKKLNGRRYDFVMTTYSQTQNPRTKAAKRKLEWVSNYAKDAIVIMDEAHNASGDSNCGKYFRNITEAAKGITFMSATYAKRPDNMVLYALRSSVGDSNMTTESMLEGIKKFGIPMQEILASALFKTGEMVRRERDFIGVQTNWPSAKELYAEAEYTRCRETFDLTIDLVNDIIGFQRAYVDTQLATLNQPFEDDNKQVRFLGEGTIREYRNSPYSGQVSTVVGLMLYAMKAKKAADLAIEKIKAGEKPVIAVENTLGTYLDEIEGIVDSADFANVLRGGIDSALRYKYVTKRYEGGKEVEEDRTETVFDAESTLLTDMGQAALKNLRSMIETYAGDKQKMSLTISPIDYIKSELKKSGYNCGEITGRNKQLVETPDGRYTVEPLKVNKKEAARKFNGGDAKSPLPENERYDALILNVAGATGISLHASRRFGDQRKRHMIILQPARDVNIEVQMRGRVDRTGQVSRAEYTYVTSPVPAEGKLTMMLRRKLASLDANAVGTEKVSSNKVNADDMDNKYGDMSATEFLREHLDINAMLDGSKGLSWDKKEAKWEGREGILYDLLIGMQRLPCETQELILSELTQLYTDQIDYLNQNGINDLATSVMDLDAVTIDRGLFVKGKDNESMSEFAHDTNIERVDVKTLKKPMRSSDINNKMSSLGALKEDGSINTEYVDRIYDAASTSFGEMLAARMLKHQTAEADMIASLQEKHPRPEGMSDENYELMITTIPSYQNLVAKNKEDYARYKKNLETQQKTLFTVKTYLKPGQPVVVPLSESKDAPLSYGRFVGFKTSKDNSPKNIKAFFAVKDSRATLELPVCSNSPSIQAMLIRICDESNQWMDLRSIGGDPWDSSITDEVRRAARDKWWDGMIPSNTSRQYRYMITGNILQSCGKLGGHNGTIVTYTKRDPDTGEVSVAKGLLLSENFDPENFKVARAVTREDFENTGAQVEDDDHYIRMWRAKDWNSDSDLLYLAFSKGKLKKLSDHKALSDETLKGLAVDGEVGAMSSVEISAKFREENWDAVLKHMYREYSFTKPEMFIMPDSTDKVDAIVYSGRPYMEVINEFEAKYKTRRWLVDSQIKKALASYKMDINNEELKQKIRELVQLRQAYWREEAAKMDDTRLAWSTLVFEENYLKATEKETRDVEYGRREAAKEELLARKIMGNTMHFAQGEATIADIEKVFKDLNKSKKNAEIAKKVFKIVSGLDMDVRVNQNLTAALGGHTKGQWVEYNWKYMNAEYISDQMKADTLLHELVHTVTAYVKDALNNYHDHLLSNDVIAVANELDSIFSLIKNSDVFKHDEYVDYGVKNWFEMLAEAGSNDEFRMDLSKVRLSVRQRSGVLFFDDVTGDSTAQGNTFSALDLILERLNDLIDNFSLKAFQEEYRGTQYGLRQSELLGIEETANDYLLRGRQIEDLDPTDSAFTLDWAKLTLQQSNYVHDLTDPLLQRLNVIVPGDARIQGEMKRRGLKVNESDPARQNRSDIEGAMPKMFEPNARFREYGETVVKVLNAGARAGVENSLDSMEEELGITINRLSRDQMPAGHKSAKGYYDTATGEVYVCMDNVADARDAMATVLHESVGHLGLRKLLGDKFGVAMQEIFASLDDDGRRWVSNYMVRQGWKPGETDKVIYAVEEYLSHLAESGDFKSAQRSTWQRIKDVLARLFDSIFGTDFFSFSDNELNYVLRAAFENLQNPGYLSTAEGWARDVLLKRELGINETDPTKPTDPTSPEGPDGGNRYRSEEAGQANLDYENDMEDWRTAAIMEVQDAQKPVRIGLDRIAKETGHKVTTDSEDYLTKENLASSKADTEAREFERAYFTPILEQIRKIQQVLMKKNSRNARFDAYEETLDYLYRVSGLERNESKNREIEEERDAAIKATRDAMQDEVSAVWQDESLSDSEKQAKAKEITAKADAHIRKLTAEAEAKKRDWSGLVSLEGIYNQEELDRYQPSPTSSLKEKAQLKAEREALKRRWWQEAEAKAKREIEAFRQRVGNDADLEELWNRIRKATDYSLEHAHKHGLLTKAEYERLHGTANTPRMWNYYLPLRGFSAETAEQTYDYSNIVHQMSNSVVVKKMEGRWSRADNPLANLLNIAETEIAQGNSNTAKQALYRYVLNAGKNSLLTVRDAWFEKDPVTDDWMLAQPMDNESFEDFEKRMQALHDNIQPDGKNGTPLARKGRSNLKAAKRIVVPGHANEHLIRLKVAGQEKMIWVNGNPALAKAVVGQQRSQNMKLLRQVSRSLSNLFTTYSIDFTARNLFRDTIYSRLALLAKEDYAYRQQFRKNWWGNFGYGAFAFPMIKLIGQWESGKLQSKPNRTAREQAFIDFMTDGGQTGYTIINSVNKIKRDLERSMRRGGKQVSKVTVPILGHIAEAIKTLNEGFELLTRFTAYQTSRDMGRSGQRAALDAKEISVNFNRKGAQTGAGFWGSLAAYLGATHYFFNAGVQGFDNFLRLFKVAPVKMTATTTGFAMLGLLAPMINSLFAGLAAGYDGSDKDDDWYWNLPQWVRRNNFVLGTGEYYILIPLPVEIRAFFGVGDIAATLMYDKASGENAFSVGLDVISTLGGILPVNPIEDYSASGNLGDGILRALAPDAGMFLIDIATNRDYTGRPLYKENPFSDTKPKSQAAYASTPESLVKVAQGIAYATANSPVHIDPAAGVWRDILKNFGGGLYTAAEDVAKIIMSDPEHPFRWDYVPFFSGFTGHLDADRMNSFETNALNDYRKVSESVVRRLNSACNTDEITSKIAYETPEKLPNSAKAQKIMEGKNYILGKTYYLETKNSKKKGADGRSRTVLGVNGLRKEWKAAQEAWFAETDPQKKAELKLKADNAWNKYYDAQGNLCDKLLKIDNETSPAHWQHAQKEVYDWAKELLEIE